MKEETKRMIELLEECKKSISRVTRVKDEDIPKWNWRKQPKTIEL